MTKQTIVILLAAVIISAGIGFFTGTKNEQSKSPANMFAAGNGNRQFARGMMGTPGAGGQRGGPNGFRPVSGEIIEASDKSITVKLSDESTKIILLSDKTTVSKAEQGTATDLKTGTTIMVFGTTNSDGSVTAQNIQIGGLMVQRGTTPPAPAK